MPVSRLKFESLPHAIFLQRVSGPESATTLEARLGQGAFLALRLVDLLELGRAPVSKDAFHYQWIATDRFCRELGAAATEGAHVHGIAESVSDAYRLGDIQLISPALFAYAHFLEAELRLEEALDVLTTLLVVVGNRLSSADAVAAYAEAGQLAAARGDSHSELLSRTGDAESVRGRGNLADAESRLQAILTDAQAVGDRDVEARAEHGIASVLYSRGQPDEAVPHFWRAFEQYEDEDSRMRALGDVGLSLLMLGDAVGAERALTEVVRRGGVRETSTNAMIELMHCASYRRDHVGFARWRERSEDRLSDMPPNIRVDFYLKQSIGQARFGRFRRAEVTMREALVIAGAAGLHEFEFRIERILAGLGDCKQSMAEEAQRTMTPVVESAGLREVSTSLAQLSDSGG